MTYNTGEWLSKFYVVIIIVALVFMGVGCQYIGSQSQAITIINEHSFIDSMGETWEIDKTFTSIISLYSAHTENLYTIGASDYLIGASATSIYPPEAAFLERFDYRADPEPIIAANPDLVIIRPFINRNYNNYVKAIKKAGIPVISLYPEDNEAFDEYIIALGIIVGKEEDALIQLELLSKRVNKVEEKTKDIKKEDKLHVYFESSKAGYKTVTIDSNPAKAIEIAGGINIAQDVKPIENGSTIAEFGIENLMINSDKIDVFVTQRGAMNSGGSLISIPQREGFKAIKAVANHHILEINEKIISSPTFRYYKGVNEIARMLYPELMDDVSEFKNDKPLTREDFAKLSVQLTHTPIFIPSSSHYYENKHLVHTYGMFEDVKWTFDDFDFIETAVTSSFIKSISDDSKEYFYPETWLTREDVAYFLYIYYEIDSMEEHLTIHDIDNSKESIIIQKVVDHQIMNLDGNNNFNPMGTISGQEVIEIFKGAH